MSWPDYAILATVGISVLVGALRGFMSEVFSLVVWVAAFYVAFQFGGDVSTLMEDHVSLPSARTAMGFAGLFIAVLLIGGLLNYLISRLVESTGLSGTDRLLGGVFGAARGLALVVLVLLLAGFTPLPADPWWKGSTSIQRLMPLVEWAQQFLPEPFAEYLEFNPAAEDAAGETQDDDGDSREPSSPSPATGASETSSATA